jgi:HPt (histidine-containing phosphotransfer) domain-containing protein
MPTSPIDTAKATQLAGGNAELARELYELLRRELTQIADTLQQESCMLEAEKLGAMAHKLRSSARFCAAARLEQAAEAAEQAARDIRDPLELSASCKHLLAAILELLALRHPYG